MISPSHLLIKHRVCMSRVAPATVPRSCFVDPRWMCRLCRSSHVPDSWNWSSLAHSCPRPALAAHRPWKQVRVTTSRTRRLSMNFRSRSYLSASELMPQGNQQWPGVHQEMEVPEIGLPPRALHIAWSPLRPILSFGATHIWPNHTKQQWSVFEVLLAGSKFPGKEGRCWAAGVDLQDSALP